MFLSDSSYRRKNPQKQRAFFRCTVLQHDYGRDERSVRYNSLSLKLTSIPDPTQRNSARSFLLRSFVSLFAPMQPAPPTKCLPFAHHEPVKSQDGSRANLSNLKLVNRHRRSKNTSSRKAAAPPTRRVAKISIKRTQYNLQTALGSTIETQKDE